MAAEWMTDAALTLVRTMALANGSNKVIAAEVTKLFPRFFVNDCMIAGAINRMNLPPRVRAKRASRTQPRPTVTQAESEMFSWHTGPLPVWNTWAADEFVREAKRRFISTSAIGRRFRIDSKTVDHATHRNRETDRALSLTTRVTRDDLARLAPFATERWSLATMIRLVDLCLRGETYVNIGEELRRSTVAAQKKAYRLVAAGIIPRRESAVAETKQDRKNRMAAIDRPAHVISENVPDDGETASFWGKRQSNSGLKASTIQWRAPTGVATAVKATRCAWSGCPDNAVDKWCADHGELLRRPAQEITHRLGTWR